MKKLIIIVLLVPLLVKAQSSSIKSWDIVKTFMGMDSANAQKILKGSGYTYQRSFENIGTNFSEFSRGYTEVKILEFESMVPDDIFLGSRNGIIEFIKMEVTDLTFNDYNNALKKDGFVFQIEKGIYTWINNKQGIKVVGYGQREINGNPAKRLDALFVLKINEKYCFLNTLEKGQELSNDIAYKSKSVDDDGIESDKYKPLLYQLACIDPNTKRDEAANAIQMFWYFNYSRMIGDIPGFNLGNRNILFYAVKIDFTELLSAFFNHYKIDRNLLYEHNHKLIRLIDYANEELESRKSERPSNKYRIQAVQQSIDIINGKYKK